MLHLFASNSLLVHPHNIFTFHNSISSFFIILPKYIFLLLSYPSPSSVQQIFPLPSHSFPPSHFSFILLRIFSSYDQHSSFPPPRHSLPSSAPCLSPSRVSYPMFSPLVMFCHFILLPIVSPFHYYAVCSSFIVCLFRFPLYTP